MTCRQFLSPLHFLPTFTHCLHFVLSLFQLQASSLTDYVTSSGDGSGSDND